MTQLELFRSRRHDPLTSKIAALLVDDFAAHHFSRILWCLKTYGSGTFHDIARYLDLEGQQVNKRLPELERMGYVRATDKLRTSPSGRLCRVWELTDKS